MSRFATPHSLCRFALASRDITPPVGMYHRMWGAASHDRSTGVSRPLRGTVLVFSSTDATEIQVLVAIDHCLLFRPQAAQLIESLAGTSSIEPSRILLTFSHTHAAGLLDPGRADLPGGELIGGYLKTLEAKLAEALLEALSCCEHVTITYATGHCSLAKNRDYWDADSAQFVCGFNPHSDADDTVVTARVTRPNGSLLATVVNYACHPTTLAWQNQWISPDYPGAMRALVESATGAPCVFLQGASGDLGPREGFVGELEVAERNGRQLGYAALEAIESMPTAETAFEYAGPVVSGATLGTWRQDRLDAPERVQAQRWRRLSTIIELPYRRDLPSADEARARRAACQESEEAARERGEMDTVREARALGERLDRLSTRLTQLPAGDRYPYRATLWQLGNALWVGVEGEPYSALQIRLRAHFPGTILLVVGLADGWGPSYLPTRETYGKGIYQEEVAVLERGCLERLIDALTTTIERWLSDKPSVSEERPPA